jgi:uncharacterized protein YggE
MLLRSLRGGVVVASILVAAAARADDAKPQDRVSVDVRGRAAQAADAIEVEVTVVATSELAKDAEKKYRERLEGVIAALKGEDAGRVTRRKKPEKPAKAKKAKPKPDDEEDDDADAMKKAPPAKKPKPDAQDSDEEDDKAPKPAKKADAEKPNTPDAEKPKAADPEKADEGSKPDGDADPAMAIPVELREEGLSIAPKGPNDDPESMQQMVLRRMNGQQGETKETTFRVASRVIAKIKDLSKYDRRALRKRVAWLIDKAMGAGATEDGGPPPRVRFIVEDGESLKRRAYADAMEKAKARAGELAKLGGRQIHRVAVVHESAAPNAQTETPTGQAAFAAAWFGANTPLAPSPTIEVSSEVELAVEFELAP